MARPGITYEEVSKTAAQLLEQGLHPSIQRIREILGTGSNSTINGYLQRWRQELGSRPKAAISSQVPDVLMSASETIWRTALEHAEAAYQEQRKQAEQAVAAAEQSRDQALVQANQLYEDVATLQRQWQELQAACRELENKLLLESERRQVAESSITAAEQKAAVANEVNEQIRQETQVTVARLEVALEQMREEAKQQLSEAAQRLHYERERGEANEVRLLRLIDQARSDHAAERSRLDTALRKSQQREADIQEQLMNSRKEEERLRATLAGVDESNRLLKIELEQAQTVQREMEAAHLQAVRQAEYLRGELEAGARERQALELALQYCHQALQACQQPPSPSPKEKPLSENDGNKPEL